MIKVFNRTAVELTIGNIVEQTDYTVIVNAANAELMPGGGVAGAIHRAAGSELEIACRPLAPIKPGEAVITGGYDLPNKYVIHTLGPVYGVDSPERNLLSKCYMNSLFLAEKNKIDSIAFPAISTGAFGYPMREAAETALGTIVDMTGQIESIKFIRIVLFDKQAYEIHAKILNKVIAELK